MQKELINIFEKVLKNKLVLKLLYKIMMFIYLQSNVMKLEIVEVLNYVIICGYMYLNIHSIIFNN